ncbi:MAG: fibronectin type III domain-containing protein [Clostridia bacterium]|nr:fibronectin type III domain-containing protein [Clostridia bacterium]
MRNIAGKVKKIASAALCALFVLPTVLGSSLNISAVNQAEYEKKSYYKNEASVFSIEPDVVTLKTNNVPELKEENFTLDLDGVWKMTNSGSISSLINGTGWDSAINATVPGSIYTALFEAGVIDDPYVGDNMKTANKYSEKNWYLKRTFNYSGKGNNVKLCFEGVCNVADFYLNGKKIGSHEGMFGGPYIDVTSTIKQGENTLVVHLKPAKDYTKTVVFNCSYGWHYAKLYPLGIWQSVSLRDDPSVTLDSPFITTTDYTKGTVDLAIDLIPKDGGAVKGTLTVEIAPKNFSGTASYFTATVNKSGNTTLRYRANVPDAHLWWPNGYGEQYLYELKTYFKASDGSSSYTVSQFGIRQLDYAPFPSGEASSSYNRQFVINGVKVYMKGAGWCTSDAMMRFSREDYDRILSRAHDANMNFFRSWGGGLVETDEFYDLCDEYGICIYQEWPCCWDSTKTQPADVLYETVVLGAKRLRNRPSLVVWGGGNEGEAPYSDKVLNQIGKLTYETDGTRDFWRQDGGPGASNIRHDHIWWSGNSPEYYIKQYTSINYLNMHEYGLGAMMNRQSIEKFAAEDELKQWPINSKNSIAYHTATFDGFYGWMETPYGHDIATHMHYASLFTDEETLDGVIIGSQLSQAQADYPLAINQRIKAPNNTANVIYKLNDNYPGASWSIVDWYGAPKIAYYLMQDAYRPVMAAFKTDRYNTIDYAKGATALSLPVYILDDTVSLKGKNTSVKVTAYDEQLQIVKEQEFKGPSTASVNKLGDYKLSAEQTDHTPLIITADLYVDGKFYNRTYMYFNYEYDSGCLFYLPRTTLQYSVSGNKITIKNTGSVPAVGVSLKSSAEDKFVCSDSYFMLTPDQSVEITVNDAKLFTGIDCFNCADPNDVTPPSKPTSVKTSDISCDSVKINWGASTDDKGLFKYEVTLTCGDTVLTVPVHRTKTEAVVTGLYEAADYQVYVSAVDNKGNRSDSKTVSFKTARDTKKPAVVSADFTDGGKIKVVFDTDMDKDRAEDISHYLLNNGAQITAASLENDKKTVLLTTKGCSETKIYTLGMIGLTDTKMNKNDLGYVSVTVERGLYMAVDFELEEDGRSYTKGKNVAALEEISGVPSFTDNGAEGRALAVNSGGGVKVSGVDFAFPENSSVVMWIKGKATEGFNLLLAKGPKQTGHFEFYTRNGELWIYAPDVGDMDLGYNINNGPDGWHMLAMMRDGQTLKVYAAGKLVSSVSFNGKIANKTYDMSFGVLNEGTYGFGGAIDSVRLYERLLSSEELSAGTEIQEPTAVIDGQDLAGKKSTTDFSLAADTAINLWFKQDSPVNGTYAILFAKAAKSSNKHFEIYTQDGILCFYAPGANSGAAVSFKTDLSGYIGSWHMLTFVHSGKRIIAYIDGKKVSAAMFSWAVEEGSETYYCGRLVEGGLAFPGSISELSFMNEAPDETAIEEMYKSKIVYPGGDGDIKFESDIITLQPGETALCGIKADNTGYKLTLKGNAASLDGETVKAKAPGEAVVCAVSDNGKRMAMTLVRVVSNEPVPADKYDANNDNEVNNKDVVFLFKLVARGENITNAYLYDYTADGKVTNEDVVALFRYVCSL